MWLSIYMTDEETFNVNISLHDAQIEVISDEHKYRVWDAGRQTGKSHVCSVIANNIALGKPGALVWIISPTYKQSSFLFKKIVDLCKECNIPIHVKKTPQDMSITYDWNGSVIMALSADNKDNLRGATLDGLIFDEAAMVNDDSVWYEVLMPMCWKEDCKVVFISTPKGKNWFYDLYKMETKDPKNWKSFHNTSESNPFIPPEFIESMRQRLDKDTFDQEILGTFNEGNGLVFYDYDVHELDGRAVQPGDMFIAGVDLAKSVDFTVVTVINITTNEVCYVDRWQKSSWDDTIERIYSIYETYNHCSMLVDSTGLGDPILERMLDRGINAYGFTFSAKTKPQIVRNLVAMLQSRELYVPNLEYFKDEMERFSYYTTPEGNLKYSAPRGYHDDCVMSFCLAAWSLANTPVECGGIYEKDEGHEYDDFIYNMDTRSVGIDMVQDSYEDSLSYFDVK